MLDATIADYRIIAELGRGGMGVVYKAEDQKLHRTVAIKVLPSHLSGDDNARKRFEQEAIAASRLEHQNICTIHHVGETESGDFFIVMPFYEGHSLQARIDEGEMSVEECTTIASQVATGLAKAHAAGILHRDIKPANIMLSDDRAVIMDFGVAKLGEGGQYTQTGATVGSLAYMSPEQAKGDVVDHRTDLWSLGVVLYEMLTGSKPFEASYPEAMLYTLLNENPVPVERDTVPESLRDLVLQLLEKDPELRPSGALNVVSRLGELEKAGERPTTIKSAQAPSPKWRTTALAFILVVIAGLAVWWFGIKSSEILDATLDESRIVVLPAVVRGGDDLQPWREELVQVLHLALQSSEEISSVDPYRIFGRVGSTAAYSEDPDRALEISGQFGAGWFLLSTVASIGQRISINTRLYRSDGSTFEIPRIESPNPVSIQSVADTIAQHIAGAMLARPGNDLPSLASTTTTSPEAFRLFLTGLSHVRASRGTEAKAALEAALALDSTFSLAAINLSVANFQATQSNVEDDRAALRLAARHADRLPPRLRILLDAELAWEIEGDPQKAEPLYRRYLRDYPEDGLGLLKYGDFLYHANTPRGRPAGESREYLERGFRLVGDMAEMSGHLGELAINDRDWERQAYWSAVTDSVRGTAPSDESRAILRLGPAEPEMRPALLDSLISEYLCAGSDLLLFLHLEYVELARRHAIACSSDNNRHRLLTWYNTAMARFGKLDSLRLAPGADGYARNLFDRVRASTLPYSPVSDTELETIREEVAAWDTTDAVRLRPHYIKHQAAVRAYMNALIAFRGRDMDALVSLEELAGARSQAATDDLYWGAVAGTVRVLRAALEGSVDETYRAFQAGPVRFPTIFDTWNSALFTRDFVRFVTAESLYNAGRFDDALPIYESLMDGFDMDGIFYLGPAYLRRAQIYAWQGNDEKAIDFYHRFVELWRDADDDLQPMVARAQEELKVIEARSMAEPL